MRLPSIAAFAAAATLSLFAAAGPMAAAAAEQPAEPSVTWGVTPADANGPDGRAWVELDVDPGDVVTEHMAVTNFSDRPVDFRLSAADGYFTDNGRFNMLQSSETSVAAGTWIRVAERVTVEPDQTAVVPFEIHVPDNATPGDNAAGVAASILSTGTADGGAAVGVESRVGFRVMTRVSGELHPALEVDGLRGAYDLSWNPFEPGSLTATYTAINTGNTRLFLDPQLDAWGRFASPADDSPAIELLPGDRRELTTSVDQVWPVGLVNVTAAVQAGPTANEPTMAVRADTIVWAVPFPQLIVAAGLALIVLATLARRRQRRNEVERMLEEARLEGERRAQAAAVSPVSEEIR